MNSSANRFLSCVTKDGTVVAMIYATSVVVGRGYPQDICCFANILSLSYSIHIMGIF